MICSMASDDAELTVYLHRQRGDKPLRGEWKLLIASFMASN